LLARCEPALELLAAGAASLNRARHADAMSCIGFVEGFLWGHGWAWRRTGHVLPAGDLSGQAPSTLVGYLRTRAPGCAGPCCCSQL
jgi:hypothetical protein